MTQQELKPKKKGRRRKHKKKAGRPRGYRPKEFEQTRIGFFLQHEAPIEYQLLKEVTEMMKLRHPPAELIESLCYSSGSPFFRKAKFWRCLMEYRKFGCSPRLAVSTNAKKELYYIRKKLRGYVV